MIILCTEYLLRVCISILMLFLFELDVQMSPQSVADLPERELTEVEFEGMVGQDLISSLKAKALEGL